MTSHKKKLRKKKRVEKEKHTFHIQQPDYAESKFIVEETWQYKPVTSKELNYLKDVCTENIQAKLTPKQCITDERLQNDNQ